MSGSERGRNGAAEVGRRGGRIGRLLGDRPRLTILLIGGVALGGIVCMCLAIAVLAYWQR